jgi:hypothetical protein
MSAWWSQGRPGGASEVRPQDYLSCVSKLGSADIKRIARLWVGPAAYKATKDACFAGIRAALDDPERVRGLVARLSEFEQAALGVLKARGGCTPPDDLASELAAPGLEGPPSLRRLRHGSGGPYDLLNELLDKGLILAVSPGSGWNRPVFHIDPSYYGVPEMVFSDRRLLAAVEAVPPRPLELPSLPAVGASWMRRPGEVMLDFLGVLGAVRRWGDLPTNKTGLLSAAAMKRLTKALGWEGRDEGRRDTPGIVCPAPFYLQVLQALGLVVQEPATGHLRVSPEGGGCVERPFREQAKAWVNAYRNLSTHFEVRDPTLRRDEALAMGKLSAARGMLLQGLASLPAPSDAWFWFEAFSDALFERAGERFSLNHIPRFYSPYRSESPAEVRKERAGWREGLRQRWRSLEGPWIADALRGPLYELGLVEVARGPGGKSGLPTCFRLTDLGQMALEDIRVSRGAAPNAAQADQSPGPCLVVQPNFEVVVYLDRVSPRLLDFLERVAERGTLGAATATYRLTRGSIYNALEAGSGIGALVKTLAEAAEHGLPPNVEATLRDWAARRERLVVRRAVRLIQFRDTAARDAAAASQRRGTPLGERYLLLDPSVSRRAGLAAAGRSIDYAAAPVRCLSVSEDATMTIDGSRADLLVQTEVARWADPEEGQEGPRWRITRDSVARARRAGLGAEEILATLSARATHALPPLLMTAIRAWGGARHTAALAPAMLLHVPDRETFYAIATSPALQRHFEGFLGSQTLVVNPGAREVLRRLLAEVGLLVESELRPAQMPAVFEPRPFSDKGSTPSRSPAAGGEDEAKEARLELGGNGLDGAEELELMGEAVAPAQDKKLLVMGQPGALGLVIGARRRRGRPRLRL